MGAGGATVRLTCSPALNLLRDPSMSKYEHFWEFWLLLLVTRHFAKIAADLPAL